MEQNYMAVPTNILTGKDLDYLSDMFNWNYGAYKKVSNEVSSINDEDVKKLFEDLSMTFESILNQILNILNEGGNNE